MKFFLTIYVCSSIVGNCFIHESTPKPQDSYYDCVRNGLSESKYKMYPKFTCEEVIVPPPKPKAEEQPTSLSGGTILRGIFRLVTYNIN